MKRIVGVLLAVFLCSNVFAQGIEFEHGTFAEAIAKAKKENKMVFMDCYTTWCGPCKMLSKNIFPQKEVGDYFNEHFVSVKMDMEKGEGIELKNKYEIRAYPTLLFIDVTEKVVHTKVGGGDAEGLIEAAKVAGDPSKQIGTLEKRYANGDRNAEFVVQYIKALRTAYRKEEMIPVGKDFIANCPKNELLTLNAFTVIDYSKALEFGSKAYEYIIANEAKFVALEGIGQKKYDGVVSTTVNNYVSGIATTGSMEELTSAIAEAKKDFTSPRQQQNENRWYSSYFMAHKEYANWYDKQLTVAKSTLETDKTKGGNMIVSSTYKVAVDTVFKDAGIYGKAITELEDLFKNGNEISGAYYCLAYLYKNQNNKEKALEYINVYLTKIADNSKRVAYASKLKTEIESM